MWRIGVPSWAFWMLEKSAVAGRPEPVDDGTNAMTTGASHSKSARTRMVDRTGAVAVPILVTAQLRGRRPAPPDDRSAATLWFGLIFTDSAQFSRVKLP